MFFVSQNHFLCFIMVRSFNICCSAKRPVLQRAVQPAGPRGGSPAGPHPPHGGRLPDHRQPLPRHPAHHLPLPLRRRGGQARRGCRVRFPAPVTQRSQPRAGALPPSAAAQGRVGKNPCLKKTSPVVFFGFSVFLGFWVFFFFLYICPEERVFRVFSVSRILLGASRLYIIITQTINLFLLIYKSTLD